MTDSDVCIACLCSDIKMHCIKNTQLSEIFEKLTNSRLSTLDGISETMCYLCYSQLHKCWRFIKMSEKAGEILAQLLSDKVQLTSDMLKVLDKRTNYVTITQQLSSINPDQSVMDEGANSSTDEGAFIDSQVPENVINVTIKEEPTNIDDQMTFEDNFVAIKHEPEPLVDTTQKSCAQGNKVHNFELKQNTINKDLKLAKKSQIENSIVASEASLKSEKHENDSDESETKRKYTKKRIRNRPKKIHTCHICDMKFSCYAYLLRHIRTHTGEKPYSCDNCGKSFSQNGHLIQHMRLHTGEKPYECHICINKAFNHRYNYKSHMKKHFGKPSHICDICKSAFHQKGDLKRHMMSHTGEKPYTCDICDVKFTQRCHLTKHLRIHSKEPYSCQYCKKTFIQKLDFNNHLTTHKELEMFTCSHEGCTKSYTKQSTLNKHFQSHIIGRPYPCKKCKKKFKQKGHLTKHIITVHDKAQTGETQKSINLELNQGESKNQNNLQELMEEYIIP